MGSDDREYRALADYDERYADAYLIDAVTGARTLLAKKQRGSMTWSPVGPLPSIFRRQGLEYRIRARRQEGEPHGESEREVFQRGHRYAEHARARTATAAGPRTARACCFTTGTISGAWRRTARAPRTSPPGYGRAHDLRLRYMRTEAENPRERWIDGTKPVMLQARESQDVRDRIFPRLARWRRARSNSSCRRNT